MHAPAESQPRLELLVEGKTDHSDMSMWVGQLV